MRTGQNASNIQRTPAARNACVPRWGWLLWSALCLGALVVPWKAAQAESFSFVMRVSDPGGVLGGRQPKVEIQSGEFVQIVEPLDNGERPDVQAGDGVYSTGVANWSSKALSLTVLTDAGGRKVIGQTRYTFESDSEHNLSLVLTESGVSAGAQDPGPAAGPSPDGAAPPSDGPEPGPISKPSAVDTVLEPVSELPWRPFAVVLGLGFVGWVVHRVLTRRRGSAVMRAGMGSAVRPLDPALPGVAQSPVLFSAPAPYLTPLTRTLVWNLLEHCDVLLVPRPDHRSSWLSEFEPTLRGIWMLEAERPTPTQIVQTAHELEALGKPVCVVLEGLEGLRGWKSSRPYRPLRALLQLGGVPLMVVLETPTERQDLPTSTPPLTTCDLELTAQEGLLRVGEVWLQESGGRLHRGQPQPAADSNAPES